jgi:hypothetical protein
MSALIGVEIAQRQIRICRPVSGTQLVTSIGRITTPARNSAIFVKAASIYCFVADRHNLDALPGRARSVFNGLHFGAEGRIGWVQHGNKRSLWNEFAKEPQRLSFRRGEK